MAGTCLKASLFASELLLLPKAELELAFGLMELVMLRIWEGSKGETGGGSPWTPAQR